MRIRIQFSKTEAMRFTGHLDLHRTWERTIRRATLPLAYSQGFHPQPRLNLAAALPLGFTSCCELADIWLEQDLPLPEIQAKLQGAVPPGIEIQTIAIIEPRAPTLQTQIQAAEYEITLPDYQPELAEQARQIVAASSLPRERRGKAYDLRPLVEELSILAEDAEDHQRLRVRLTTKENATGRPEELLAAMGIPHEATRIQRTKLILPS